MDKWYIESGTLKEVVVADSVQEGMESGLRKGIDRNAHNETEFTLGLFVIASNKGFVSDIGYIENDNVKDKDVNSGMGVWMTSIALDLIGEDEMANAMREFEEEGRDKS